MRKQGIEIVAETLSVVQQRSGELMRLGCSQPDTLSGQQDIRLAHLLDQMKDCIKEDFCKETVKDIEEA